MDNENIKEILDYFVIHSTDEELEMLSKISTYITNLQEENKNLKQINEEHRKINGELRKTINEAIEYIKEDMYVEPKELYGLVDGEHLLNILPNAEVDILYDLIKADLVEKVGE